jgi:hypothetical protein
MDNQLKYGKRVLKVLSYIDDKINPETYVQKGGKGPHVIEHEKQIPSGGEESEYTKITVQINDKTQIIFKITPKD